MLVTNIDIEGNSVTFDDGIPEEVMPLSAEVIAAQAISDEITSRISTATTIAQLRNGITSGLAAALAQLQAQ